MLFVYRGKNLTILLFISCILLAERVGIDTSEATNLLAHSELDEAQNELDTIVHSCNEGAFKNALERYQKLGASARDVKRYRMVFEDELRKQSMLKAKTADELRKALMGGEEDTAELIVLIEKAKSLGLNTEEAEKEMERIKVGSGGFDVALDFNFNFRLIPNTCPLEK